MTDDLKEAVERLELIRFQVESMVCASDEAHAVYPAPASVLDAIDLVLSALKAAERPQPLPGDGIELDCYDAGLLSDYGGGNVEWWWDYLRAELGRAHSFYQSQVAALSHVSTPGRSIQSSVGLRPEGLSPSREDRQQLRTGDAP